MTRRLIIYLFLGVATLAQGQIQYANKSFLKEIDAWSKGAKLEPLTFTNNQLQGRFFIVTNNGLKMGIAYVGRVNSCSKNGCSVNSSPGGGSEYFDYYAIFNTAHKLCRVSIFNYQATHGQEVTARSWLNQFVGYDGSKKLDVGINIDAISGATKSTYSFTDNIQQVLTLLKQYQF